MSLTTHAGVAVVLPCVLGVFCVVSRAALVTSDRRVRSCRTTGVPLIILSDISYPTSAALLLELCFPGRQNCNRTTHCATANLSLHTHAPVTTLHYVHVHRSRTLYWCLEFDVVEQSPHIHHGHLIHRMFVAVYLHFACETWTFRLTNRRRMGQW